MRKSGCVLLSAASVGSPWSYELRGKQVVVRLFGMLPLRYIRIDNIHYLRLATRDEVSVSYLLLNWFQFLPHRRTIRPVYVLQTRKGHRCFLKLKGGAHFRLRQAIGRHQEGSALQRTAASKITTRHFGL